MRVDWAQEHDIGTLVIGDVRDIADGKRLQRTQRQKISQWGHGTMRRYSGYKAQAAGITVVDTIDEAYTSQTCPRDGHWTKPKGAGVHLLSLRFPVRTRHRGGS
jgi:putative transposase